MNRIDQKMTNLINELKSMSEKELYFQMRLHFERLDDKIKESLSSFLNQFMYWGVLDPHSHNYEAIERKQEALSIHLDDFIWVYDHLGDYRSKALLYAILSNWYRYDFESTAMSKEYLYDDYFDLDLVKCGEDEVVVDLGAYIGDSTLSYIHNFGMESYQKIYCYEITPGTFESLKTNLEGYPNIECRLKGIGDSVSLMKVREHGVSPSANTLDELGETEVQVTTLDDDIKEKITLIKADIEGMEVSALKGARRHILEDHPKLLFSVYHNNEDLWRIPKMIYEMDASYQFYLRFNSSPLYPTEITLYAI